MEALRNLQTKKPFVEPVFLAYFGRSGSCMMHVLLLNNGLLFGPEIQIEPSDLETLHFDSLDGTESRQLCRRHASLNRNMFHHFPAEGLNIDYGDHSKCCCMKQKKSSKLLLHTHNLLYSERLFLTFIRKCREGGQRRKVVITTMNFSDAVFSIEQNNKHTNRSWLGNKFSILGVAISCAIAELRLLKLKQKADVFEIDIDDFNDRHEKIQIALYRWLGIEQRVIPPHTLSIRGKSWTGGNSPAFGSRIRVDKGSRQTKRALMLLRPSGILGMRGLTILSALLPLDLVAVALLTTAKLLPSRFSDGDVPSLKFYLLARADLVLRLSFANYLVGAIRARTNVL